MIDQFFLSKKLERKFVPNFESFYNTLDQLICVTAGLCSACCCFQWMLFSVSGLPGIAAFQLSIWGSLSSP